jgi:hypothetical protein
MCDFSMRDCGMEGALAAMHTFGSGGKDGVAKWDLFFA